MRTHHLGVALVGLVAGCSSTDAGAPPVVPPANEAGTAPVPTGTLDLVITEGRRDDVLVSHRPVPFPNANVSFYPPGGAARMDLVVGADGLAHFTGIDWSLGRGTIVAYAPGHTVSIVTDVDPETAVSGNELWDSPSALTIPVGRLVSTVPAASTLTGKLLNKKAAGNLVGVGASVPGTQFLNVTPTFSITADPMGQPFMLLATEVSQTAGADPVYTYEKWVKVEAPAGAVNIDIDFATATVLTSTKISRTFVLPGGAKGALGGAAGYLSVGDELAAGLPLGFVAKRTFAADGNSVAVDAEYVTEAPFPITQNVLATADSSSSFVIERGFPENGKTLSDFLPPPAVSATQAKLKDPITVEGVEVGARTGLYANADNGDLVLSMGSMIPAATASVTITFPELPPAARDQLGTSSLTAAVALHRTNDFLPGAKTSLLVHQAVSRSITLYR